MAYVAPSSKTSGTPITATIWNQDVVSNMLHIAGLKSGGTALGSQTAGSELLLAPATDYAADISTRSSSASSYGSVSGTVLSLTPEANNSILVIAYVEFRQDTAGNGFVKLVKKTGGGTLATQELSVPSGNTYRVTLLGRYTGAYSKDTLQEFEVQQKTDGSGTVNCLKTVLIALAI